MEISSDPYEQKLYYMFKSYDTDSVGTLDETKLIKLCNSLELNDNIIQLILQKSHNSRVTFKDFKEALLHFLGTEMENSQEDKSLVLSQSDPSNSSSAVPDSPGREVSPKLIVGTKKYGRRSRPQSIVIDTSPSDTDDDRDNEIKTHFAISNLNNKNQKVQRSSSQSDITRKQRRPQSGGTKLKRCASLPIQHRNQKSKQQLNKQQQQQQQQHASSVSTQNQLTSSVESLGNLDFENLSHKIYEIWKNYGNELGTHYLNCKQLEIICQRIGLLNKIANKVAEEVFEKLNLNINTDKINYMDFIELIQNDNNTNDNINNINEINDNNNMIIKDKILTTLNDNISLLSSSTSSSLLSSSTAILHHHQNKLCNLKDTTSHENDLHVHKDYSTHLESIPAMSIIDMWQSAGVHEPKMLLSNLGFENEEVNISHLLSTLEEESISLHGEALVSVLKATLVLRKAEISSLQQIFRQLFEENKKLHSDNKDANRRAAMLAQEIDERHASLEDTTKTEIRMLEQRHAEVIRDLTSQLANDREHWSNLNAKLEMRVKNLEQEENRLKLELQTVHDENSALEKEQISLQKQVTDLLETNIKLNNEVVELEDQQRSEFGGCGENETEEVLELIDKITSLQIENANLRDKNDELVAEVEGLNVELSRFKTKKSSRNTSASSSVLVDSDALSDDMEQTSLGGVKRRGDSPSKTRTAEESPRLGKLRKCNKDNNSESDTSGDWVALNSEMSSTMINMPSTGIVTAHSTTSGFSQDFSSISDGKDEEIRLLKEKIISLEKELEELRNLAKTEKEKNEVRNHTEEEGNAIADENKTEEQQKVTEDECSDDVTDYEVRCQDLENSLEQMRKAYEDCEDYWQAKLNDERVLFEMERQIYEEEQQENNKKFTELMEKIHEYEEQFDKEGRLSPIEEKDALEQQYNDLETELNELKKNAQKMYEEKSKEITDMQEQIKMLKQKLASNNPNSLNAVTDVLDTESPASSPISYLWNQSTIQAPARDYQNPNWNSKDKADVIASFDAVKLNSPTKDLSPPSSSSAIRTCISPIQKPIPSNKNQLLASNEIDETGSNGSVKSSESRSVASTHSIHKSSLSEQSAGDGSTEGCDLSSNIKEELKKLKFYEVQLKEQIKDLAHKRDGLVMELQQLHEAKPVLEKAYARAAHPSLLQKVNQLEQKNRHLQNVIRQQQQYSDAIMHQNWQQQRQEIIELRNRLETQGMMLTEQAQRLANADILVKDLYVENSHLTAAIQRLEQQRNRAALVHQHQGLTGMP